MNRNITSTMTIDNTKKPTARPLGAKQGATGVAIVDTVNLGQGFQQPAPTVKSGTKTYGRKYLAGGKTGMTAAEYTPADRQPESRMLYETAARQRPLTPMEKMAQQEALKRMSRGF